MGILEIVLIVLLVAWLGGFSLKIGGSLIHILLIVAVFILVARVLGVTA
jgi:hypothetical protein